MIMILKKITWAIRGSIRMDLGILYGYMGLLIYLLTMFSCLGRTWQINV